MTRVSALLANIFVPFAFTEFFFSTFVIVDDSSPSPALSCARVCACGRCRNRSHATLLAPVQVLLPLNLLLNFRTYQRVEPFFYFFCSVTARPYTHQKWGSEQNRKVSATRVPLAMKLLIAHFLKIVCENIGRQSSGIFRRLRGKRCLGRVGSEAGGRLYYKALKRLNVWPEIIKPNENWLFWYRGVAGE